MFDFKLPDLGEGIHEGQVVSLLVKEGDRVAEFQPIMEVETDKAAVQIPSPKAGTIAKFHAAVGQVVKTGQVLVSIDESGGAAPAQPAKPTAAAAKSSSPSPATAPPAGGAQPPRAEPSRPEPARSDARTPVSQPRSAPTERRPAAIAASGGDGHSGRSGGVAVAQAPAAPSRSGPVPAAPVVRKLAREMGVDINAVPGSGPHGRIMREDVQRHATGDHSAPAGARSGSGASAGFAGPETVPAGAELPDFSQYGPIRREPATQIRKTIARQMMRAWQNVPRVTHSDVADITEMESNRKRLNATMKGSAANDGQSKGGQTKAGSQQDGQSKGASQSDGQTKISLTAIVLKATAAALRQFPILNTSYDAASGEIIYKDYIHLGVAVDTPRGLVVPVLRDVDKRSLLDIAAALNDLAQRTKESKFEIAELRGATFTVSNPGPTGGLFFTPMVNYPEVGILGVGKAAWQPAVRDGQIVPRFQLSLSLSFDHRVVDGADAARFARYLIDMLENPLRMISAL